MVKLFVLADQVEVNSAAGLIFDNDMAANKSAFLANMIGHKLLTPLHHLMNNYMTSSNSSVDGKNAS
jgi:hypothetical protein